MSDKNSVTLHLTFASPAEATPVADALAQEGWDIWLHVVLDATATGSSVQLRRFHDRFKEIAPAIGLTNPDDADDEPAA